MPFMLLLFGLFVAMITTIVMVIRSEDLRSIMWVFIVLWGYSGLCYLLGWVPILDKLN
jgi:hypothetical protein